MSIPAQAVLDDTQSNLLIVADQKHNPSNMAYMLKSVGQVTCVNDGATALDALSRYAYDAVVLDMKMQDMSGLDVLKAIRSKPETLHLPVILLSRPSTQHEVLEGLHSGANDFIEISLREELAAARIQAQIQLKRELEATEARITELERIRQEQTRLISVFRHDFRNPLSNLRMAESLFRRSQNGTGDERLLDSVAISLDSLEEIFNDFSAAFVIRNEVELRPERFAIQNIIYDAVMNHTTHAYRKNITLNVEKTEGCVFTDKYHLSQILGQLISNGVKYSPPDMNLWIRSTVNNGRVRIAVQDQGPGIPGDERHLLFTQFGRLSTNPTAHEVRTGLGLWLVKNLVEMMGGTYGIDQPGDGGSEFWIEFPAAESESS